MLHGSKDGEATLTKGYRLLARGIIHTVGPVWQGGSKGEAERLASCYRRSLEIARAHDCRTVAFPAISTGIYRYPKDEAADIAVGTARNFLQQNSLLRPLFSAAS